MTTVLGLHFGHDASITVLVHGRIAAFVQRERVCRIKHAYSLDRDTLDLALSQAGVDLRNIDLVTVTSTQGSEPILAKFFGFDMRYDPTYAVGPKPLLVNYLGDAAHATSLCARSMIDRVFGHPRDPRAHPAFDHYFAEYSDIPASQLRRFPWLDHHVNLPGWELPQSLSAVQAMPVASREEDPRCRYGFHYPLRVQVDGHTFPGLRVDHHLAHAASSFYRSAAETAVVITNDGYGGRRAAFANGGVYLGVGPALIALAPHFLTHGHLYDAVARHLGLGAIGGSGKLMGLAPYGRPRLFDERFVGTVVDCGMAGIDGSAAGWITFATQYAKTNRAEVEPLGRDIPFDSEALDLAASTQKLFEETWLAVIQSATEALLRQGRDVKVLCLSGGSALNCASNSRVLRESNFDRVFIEPNCDDGGLSIGSALWAYHGLLGNAVKRLEPFGISEVFGVSYSAETTDSEIAAVGAIDVQILEEPAIAAAKDVAAGKLVGWFEGGGEMGPRALGHRSILADPRARDMLQRINKRKGREAWRPLAPMVDQEAAGKWFDMSRLPPTSPFMLLTAAVATADLPAITHVDGTARLQTLTREAGEVFFVVCAFADLTGIRVLLNTSLNAPGEPIAERPRDAVALLCRGLVDVLYVDGRRLLLNS